MAIYLIVSAILSLFESSLFRTFLNFAVQLLNFAVLLSYPINFFIYCRMSRSFRDAFTRLLCPNYGESRDDHLQSVATPLINKTTATVTLTDHPTVQSNLETKSENNEKRATSLSVIPSPANVLEPTDSSSNLKIPSRHSMPTATKPRVSFSDDLNPTNFTDL